MKFYLVLFSLIASFTTKHEILITGRIVAGDSVSILKMDDGILFNTPQIRVVKGDTFHLIDDSKTVIFSTKNIDLIIRIDSNGINKLDTLISVSSTIKEPNILFTCYSSQGFKRKVFLRDFSFVPKY